MSTQVKFRDCEEPPCPALQRLGEVGREMWAGVRGTPVLVGKPCTHEELGKSNHMAKWEGCDADTYWPVESGPLYHAFVGRRERFAPGACRHMLDIGD